MKKRFILTAILISLFFHYSFSKNPATRFFSKADKFFSSSVTDGFVDYSAIKKSPAELNELVSLIASIDIDKEKPEVQKAYYINLYNLLIIKSVVDLYPVSRPVEYLGMFSNKYYQVGVKKYSLNEIELLLMTKFNDLRVLFLLSSASIGSPKLASFAYDPKKLEKQIEAQSKLVCNDSEYIRVAKNISTVMLSESFRKSQKSFKKEEIITVINKVREEPLPTNYLIDFYPINRQLNVKGIPFWH